MNFLKTPYSMKKIKSLALITFVFIFNNCSENNIDCSLNPSLTTNKVTEVSQSSAKLSAEIILPTCDNTVTSQGFVYSKTTLPKIDDFVVELNGENILAQIENLEENTTYFVRAFFINPIGEFYGNEIVFQTTKFEKTYVPDDVFETILIRLGYDDVLDDFVDNKNIININKFSLSDNVNNLSINDATGLENFIGLDTLHCGGHKFKTLDLSKMKELQHLYLDYGELTSLDISNNKQLKWLIASRNKINSIDFTQNTELTLVDVRANEINTVDITNNINLITFNISKNNINSIDFSKNLKLQRLALSENPITSNIDVSNHIELRMLSLSSLKLSSIDLTKNINLTNLYLKNNYLTSLDLSSLSELGSLVCDQNQFSTIDISNNKKLHEIRLRENNLSEINISNQDNLREIWLNNNKITSMILGEYPNFQKLEIKDNNLESLNISNVKNWFNLSTKGNSNLICIKASEFHVNNWTTNGLFNVDNFTTLATTCN